MAPERTGADLAWRLAHPSRTEPIAVRRRPDFVALLTDGRVLAVEYKGKQLAELEKEREKRIIGDLWASASEGACALAMPVAGDFLAIDRAIAAAA